MTNIVEKYHPIQEIFLMLSEKSMTENITTLYYLQVKHKTLYVAIKFCVFLFFINASSLEPASFLGLHI